MKWTEQREELLATYRNLGATAISKAIFEETRGLVSEHGVEVKASRLGISLRKLETCPNCGGVYRKLYSDGLCPACHFERLTSVQLEETGGRPLKPIMQRYALARKHKSNAIRHGN